MVLRIHFTAEDFLRTTIADRPMPLLELSLALSMLQRRDPHAVLTPWRRQAGRDLPRTAYPLLNLISPQGAGPLFLDPPSQDLEDGLDLVLATPRARAENELRQLVAFDRPDIAWTRHLAARDAEAWTVLEHSLRSAYDSLITSAWPRLLSGFQAETSWRSSLLTRQGLYAGIAALHPSARWNGLTLESDLSRDMTIRSEGLGVILQPSLYWDTLLATYHPDGRIVVIYPAVTPLALRENPTSANPLNVLLGATRAEALRLLVRQHTTTDLAKALSVSAAAASMQARTLREAGLVVSQREGRAVWHWCTALGLDLLAHAAG